jgi:hypothetical protein
MKYQLRVAGLCDSAAAGQEMPNKIERKNGRARSGTDVASQVRLMR